MAEAKTQTREEALDLPGTEIDMAKNADIPSLGNSGAPQPAPPEESIQETNIPQNTATSAAVIETITVGRKPTEADQELEEPARKKWLSAEEMEPVAAVMPMADTRVDEQRELEKLIIDVGIEAGKKGPTEALLAKGQASIDSTGATIATIESQDANIQETTKDFLKEAVGEKSVTLTTPAIYTCGMTLDCDVSDGSLGTFSKPLTPNTTGTVSAGLSSDL